MNALAVMANQLQAAEPSVREQIEGKAARMRQELRDNGRQTARDLASVVCVPTGRVSALLKHDIAAGRVHLHDGCYSWNFDWIEPATEYAVKAQDAIDTLAEEGWIWDGDQWQRPVNYTTRAA